ncbi:hypothetical protein ONA70_10070 [Micromonospora yasonensis]|uniref:hypothetical protein n=1 Tax=Micromonospora yasonensis TaxID=1128667 RepID=UPI0022329979|nr:hypothetical protein [Micromonospora yasonensis]MCW3840439.1 hypothetical protein [Micromonospora yasonensis]
MLISTVPPALVRQALEAKQREAIEIVLTMQSDDDQPISRADALRALTLLRPVRRAA